MDAARDRTSRLLPSFFSRCFPLRFPAALLRVKEGEREKRNGNWERGTIERPQIKFQPELQGIGRYILNFTIHRYFRMSGKLGVDFTTVDDITATILALAPTLAKRILLEVLA
jgi:hypothetical protein